MDETAKVRGEQRTFPIRIPSTGAYLLIRHPPLCCPRPLAPVLLMEEGSSAGARKQEEESATLTTRPTPNKNTKMAINPLLLPYLREYHVLEWPYRWESAEIS